MGAFLSANFVTPWALLGATAIAAPILIWLINRFRTQVVEWAAIEFLRRAVQKARRRMRLEEILLLIIRCLIIILLAVIFARPRGQTNFISEDSDSSRSFVILIDASYSMGYQVGSTQKDTVFQRAKVEARKIINTLGRKDRLILDIYNDRLRYFQDIPRTMDEAGKLEALKILEDPEFAVSSHAANGAEIFRQLPMVLQKFDTQGKKTGKTVFLLFDSQNSCFFRNGKIKDPTIPQSAEEIGKNFGEIKLVDCSEKKTPNVSVLRVKTRDPIVGVGIPCRFEVRIKNFDPSEVSGLNLEYFVDDLKTPVKRVPVKLNGSQELKLPDFSYEFRDPGSHRFQVRFSSDKLLVDNSRSLIVDVREAVRVLIVNGDPHTGPRKWDDECHYLRGALEPGGTGRDLIRPQYIEENNLGEFELEPFDIVLLANIATLSDVSISRLESFANQGGVIVFSMGSRTNESFYNQRLYRDGNGIFPARLGDVVGREKAATSTEDAPEWEFELADKNFPPLKLFGDKEMRKWLKYPTVYRLFQVEESPNDKNTFRTLVEFIPRAQVDDSVEDGPNNRGERGPALIEKSYGQGLCVAYLTSIDADWNRAPAFDVFYVIFWRNLLLHLSQTATPRRHLAVGETFEYVLSQEEYSKTVRITRPDGQPTIQTPQEIKDNKEQFRLSFNNTEIPGIYSVDFVDSLKAKQIFFAVNIDPNEGDLSKLNTEDLNTALPGVQIGDMDLESMKGWLAENNGGDGSNEYWRFFLYMVLGLLVAESVLAMLFGRRRQ
jgi:hypothetical protein